MALPTQTDVHVNRPLTNISVAYIQSQNRFIADRVFPSVPVGKQSDRYFKYDKEDWFRTEAALRGPAAESAGSGWRLDNTPTYFADVFAVHKDLDDQIVANTDAPLNMQRDATMWLTQQLLLKRDIDFVDAYMKLTVWGKDKDGVASGPTGDEFIQWNEAASTPIEDINAEVVFISEQTGTDPTQYQLTITPYVLNVLRNHADILERIKYTQRGIVTADLLAALFGVKRVNVAWATQNTEAEGVAATMSFIAPKAALLTYSPASPSLMEPSAGYIFSWTGLLGSGAQTGTRISNMRMPLRKANRLEAEMSYDMQVVASDCGIYFDSAVA